MDLNGGDGGTTSRVNDDSSNLTCSTNCTSSVKCTIRKNQLLASIPNFGKPYKTFTLQLNNIEIYFGKTTNATTTTTTTTNSTDTTGTSTTLDNQQQNQQQQQQQQQEDVNNNNNIQTIEWNKSYTAAQLIFNETSTQSKLIRTAIHSAYNRLYVGNTAGLITPMKHITLHTSNDLLNTIFKVTNYYNSSTIIPITTTGTSSSSIDDNDNKIMYTYVILPNGEWRFSKTYHPIFDETRKILLDKVQDNTSGKVIDFMSKHALMSNCSRSVVYAGEFYIQPVQMEQTTNDCIKNNTDNQYYYILIIDNGSGTYLPQGTKEELYKLQLLLQNNFPNLLVIAHHYKHIVTNEELIQAIKGKNNIRNKV